MTDLAQAEKHLVPGLYDDNTAMYWDLEGLATTLADPNAKLADRAASYAVLQQLRLRLDRALKANRDDLIIGMERDGLRELGPLSIKSSAVDPTYPCNERDNWQDSTVQDGMVELSKDEATRPYVRFIPGHMEIAVDVLSQDVRMGVQTALDLYRELNRKGWRREVARRLSLAVREATR